MEMRRSTYDHTTYTGTLHHPELCQILDRLGATVYDIKQVGEVKHRVVSRPVSCSVLRS